ncbi:MAG: hypothetical protein GQ577_09660 [Woeseiaceae bacterium]|nr:hypothetical protein [Woeseiaceae bacterium]
MASVWGELKRRNVVRVAIAYVIVGWLVLQAASVLVPLLALPETVGRLVFLFLIIGFPLALFFAWAFELTPEGIKREKDVDRTESVTHVTGRKLDFTIIGVLAIALMFFAVDKFVLAPVTTATVTSPQEEVATEARQSIAVLPFVNMSSDSEQEYFSDGLSEELLNLLAKIPDLKVIARTSSFAFKGKNEDLRVIGQALGATTVLEGSVRKSGERVRITAQLIDVADGTHLWSETYDRTITDIFAVQDDVAKSIIDALEIHVGAAPTRGRPTDNPEAYALFLKARVQANESDFESAESILREAVALDPNFAEAHELLAYSYWWLAGFTVEGAKGQLLMLNSANRALDIDPTLTFARTLQQSGSSETFTWVDELDQLAQVLREQPNNGQAFDALTFDLLETGYVSEGLEVAEQWVEIDPLSAAAHIRLHEYLLAIGRKADAMAALQVALEIGSEAADVAIAFLDLADGRDEDAIGRYEVFFRNRGYADVSWVRELITGGRDPANGQAFLDRRIPEIVASMPTNHAYFMQQSLVMWYLPLGYLDRYAELTLENSIANLVWNDADNQMYTAMTHPSLGMIAHPVFLEALEVSGIVELWNDRGAPDRCDKADGEWVCR